MTSGWRRSGSRDRRGCATPAAPAAVSCRSAEGANGLRSGGSARGGSTRELLGFSGSRCSSMASSSRRWTLLDCSPSVGQVEAISAGARSMASLIADEQPTALPAGHLRFRRGRRAHIRAAEARPRWQRAGCTSRPLAAGCSTALDLPAAHTASPGWGDSIRSWRQSTTTADRGRILRPARSGAETELDDFRFPVIVTAVSVTSVGRAVPVRLLPRRGRTRG
jgi:hypothetical protein